jgi:hypothetical protein
VTYDRQVELLQKRVIAQATLDTASRNLDVAKQSLAAAQAAEERARLSYTSQFNGVNTAVARLQAELQDAEHNLEQTVVRAPTDGYVTQLFLSPGMMAVPLALRPVMVFVHSHDNLFAVAFQQNALQRVRVGDEAEIAFDAIPGRVFKGRIKRVIDAVSQFVADAHGSQSMPDGNAIDLIPIADKVARGLIPRECLCDLARDPVRGRMRCDVDPDEVSAGQPHDDEGIEQVEAKGRGAHAAGRRLMRAARSCYAFVSALSPTTRSCSSLRQWNLRRP